MSPNKKKWFIRGGLGAALFGLGLCCLLESAFLKHGHSEVWLWAVAGTISLVITISGLSLLIDSLRFKLKMEKDD